MEFSKWKEISPEYTNYVRHICYLPKHEEAIHEKGNAPTVFVGCNHPLLRWSLEGPGGFLLEFDSYLGLFTKYSHTILAILEI